VRVPDRLPKALAVEEVLALIDGVGDATPHDLRDRAIIELLYGSGLRVSELCSLEWIRLDLDERLVRVVGKGDKERVVPISAYAAAALRTMRDADLNERSRRSRYVFASRGGAPLTRQGVWYLLKRRGAAVGLAQVLTPHVLRHSCATHMIQGGADLRVVQELLGHVDLSTTQIYTRITIDHLVEVFRSAHPRDRVGFGERRR
ncbi:MAG: tyrosine-type recombinase/integrase, partial [Acidimicrobiales bacterium]